MGSGWSMIWQHLGYSMPLFFLRVTIRSEKVNFPSSHCYLGEKKKKIWRFYYSFSAHTLIAWNQSTIWHLQESLFYSTDRTVEKYVLKIQKYFCIWGLQTCLLLLTWQLVVVRALFQRSDIPIISDVYS